MTPHQRIIWATCLLLFTGTTFLIYRSTQVKEETLKYYQALLEMTNPQPVDDQNPKSTQESTLLQKEIWIGSGSERKQILLNSTDAQLELHPKKDSIEVIEHLKNVVIYLQEDLYFVDKEGKKVDKQGQATQTVQQILCIKSKLADYHWNTYTIITKDADIERFQTSGTQIPKDSVSVDQSIMHGNAESVVLSFAKQNISFKAYRFKAKILSKNQDSSNKNQNPKGNG